ncbi:MAG: hypothetical protein J6Y98_08125 [Bacteroidales bacterium]|nr:hypothetical protein [Bacteroidales bacterium]
MKYNDLIEIGAWSSVIFKILILFLVVVILILLAILLYYYVNNARGRKLTLEKIMQRIRPVNCYYKGYKGEKERIKKVYVIGGSEKGVPNYQVFYDVKDLIKRINRINDVLKLKEIDEFKNDRHIQHVESCMYAICKNPTYGKGVDWTSDYEYYFGESYYFNCYLPGWE